MPIQARRERERAERERAIVDAAMELAEAEGWDAVTTRRLASVIEYSQPVLYSHFRGKGAIMAAVAVEGCADFATRLATAREGAPDAHGALAAVAAAYTRFAEERPALYDAMFVIDVDLPFATPEAPPALQAAFGELLEVVQPVSGDDDPALVAETFWSCLHGLVTLMRSGRMQTADHERRLALLLDRFTR